MQINFREIVSESLLQELLDHLYNLVGVPISIFDPEGEKIIASGWKKICIDYHRQDSRTLSCCLENNIRKNESEEIERDYQIYKCENGLMNFMAPIFLDKQHIATIFISQFFIEPPDTKFFEEQAEKYDFDKEDYLKALAEVPILSKEHVIKVMDFMVNLAKILSTLGEKHARHTIAEALLKENYEELEASFEQLTAYEEELHESYDQLKKKEEALIESESRYNLLFANMGQGMAMHEMIYDKEGKPCDYRFLQINDAFEMMTGLKKEDIIGKTVLEVLPETETYWIEFYGEIVSTGIQRDFENYSQAIRKYFHVHSYSYKPGEFAVLITDVTDKREQELRRKKQLMDTVESLGRMIEERDLYTSGHQKNVSYLACRIAERVGLSSTQIEGLKVAALLHDIGKISIPSEILTKPCKLSYLEFELVKNHSKVAYEILKSIDFNWPVADIVLQHHEKIDGSGYPNGLKGDEILIEAKIITVADVVEAITAHRPYRPALGIDVALKEIQKYSGVWYDEKIVEACISICKEPSFSFISSSRE